MPTKECTIKTTWSEKEGLSVEREVSGFNALELLGILCLSSNDIIRQMKGEIKPTVVVERKVEKNKKESQK